MTARRAASVALPLLLAVLAAGLFVTCRREPARPPGAAASRPATATPRPFTFAVLADPQLGLVEANRGWTEEAERLRWAVGELNRLRPAFVVLLGDLIQEPGNDREAAAFREALRSLDPAITVRLVAGNHDQGEAPTPESLDWYRATFGPDRCAFDANGCRFIILNSGLLYAPQSAPEEAEAQSRWLGEELAAARSGACRRVVLFQHHPWFWERLDEPESIEILPRAARERWLSRLAAAGVTEVFAGHAHTNHRGRFGARGTEMRTVGSLARTLGGGRSGFLLVTVTAGGLATDWRELPDALQRPALR